MAEITGDGFYVSFNPDTRGGMFGDADGGTETALVLLDQPCGKDGHLWTGSRFFILKGDFRDEYRELVAGGADTWALKAFYDDKKKLYGSRWSSDFQDWGRDGKRRPSRQKAA